jgi:hypothetical protein
MEGIDVIGREIEGYLFDVWLLIISHPSMCC